MEFALIAVLGLFLATEMDFNPRKCQASDCPPPESVIDFQE